MLFLPSAGASSASATRCRFGRGGWADATDGPARAEGRSTMSPELLRVADWLIVAVLVAILLGPVWLVVRVVRHRRLTGPERAERRRTTWLIARVWLSAVAVFV